MAATLRSTRISANTSASSITLAWPTGTIAGDTVFLFAAHGYQVNTPTGWTVVHASNQSFWNGAIFKKILVAADITTGSATVTFTGTYNDFLAMATYIGTAYQRTYAINTNTGGATSRVVTTDGTPVVADRAVYFGSGRTNATVTSSAGTSLETLSAANGSGVLAEGTVATAGAQTSTFSFTVAGSGDYSAILIVTDTDKTSVRVEEVAAEVLTPGVPYARMNEVAAEVLTPGIPEVRMNEVAVEVLRSISGVLAATGGGFVSIIW